MTAGARLLSVRLQGFKSFAARTALEFGPGISAVVGPNGAGKSNLADALRWTFGEQGRVLRSRRAEDIIFAGSEGRAAVGMADVTVVVDNSDGLLPIEYSVVELGRRLYRSGENEYLLNGTRVRLRDLDELLDAAHLADNAFLFIGQGMVDQALALRPEERRPLFDEVAGVRRHDRRKRAAEAQLVESEANLARVGDLLAEMRPQARRLAAQARQQAARSEAAAALAAGIVANGRFAWHEASTRLRAADERRSQARTETDDAIGELRTTDEAIAAASVAIEDQLRQAREARARLDESRAALAEARIDAARTAAEREARSRELDRLQRERHSVEERVAAARRRLALPAPIPPGEPEDEPLAAAGERASADDRQAAARQRLDALRRAEAQENAAFETATAEETTAAEAADAARTASRAAASLADAARTALATAREAAAAATGRRDAAAATARETATRVAGIRDRLAEIEHRIGTGSRVDASRESVARGLRVEPGLQPAIEAALGAALDGTLVASDSAGLADTPSTLVFRDVAGPELGPDEGADAITAAAREGGGRTLDGVVGDPHGMAARLLRRALWVPDRAAALRVAPFLPPGWTVSTASGQRLHPDGLFEPPAGGARLALEQERTALDAELPAAAAAAEQAARSLAALERELSTSSSAVADAERRSSSGEAERRATISAQERAERRHELAAREAAWARVQRERRHAEIARLEAVAGDANPATERPADRVAAWAAYRDALRERQRLEGQLAADTERLDALDGDLAGVARSVGETEPDHERTLERVAALESTVDEHVAVVAKLDAAGSADRHRLDDAERARRRVRDRIQTSEGRARAAEIDELQARMTLDGVRERLLVELASLGGVGLTALDGDAPALRSDGTETLVARLELALGTLEERWSSALPEGEPPTAGRLASLRRRYEEVGVENPFAAEEHAEISSRLAELEGQREDLVRAIASTRELIADLERLIVEQFQATFRALGSAFERRFAQLFDGGTARLSLTDPEDLARSGVEIIARPPGKKPQALAMLSGGERALTAVALLFAMLEVRPVPFCVLDEVDAALDEANIGRFAAALRDLAGTIQFIVITHNRGTIEQADALYGVTIGDDAVSRVVSLRLESAAGGETGAPARTGSSATGDGRPGVLAVDAR